MLKEQSRLESIIQEQNQTIAKQTREIENLRKKSEVTKSRNVVTPTSDMDTPSSEDGGSPKSSFNKGVVPLPPSGLTDRAKNPPALPPRRNSSTSSSSSTGSSGGKPPVPSRAGVNRKLLMKKPDEDSNGFTGDEGFCSSHEDQTNHKSHNNNSTVSPSRQLTNHRGVQKPSDIKYRSKLRSTSNLGALEEHQVISNAPITTVTYLDYF